MIDMEKLIEGDYCDTLPPEEQEILMEYAASETLCWQCWQRWLWDTVLIILTLRYCVDVAASERIIWGPSSLALPPRHWADSAAERKSSVYDVSQQRSWVNSTCGILDCLEKFCHQETGLKTDILPMLMAHIYPVTLWSSDRTISVCLDWSQCFVENLVSSTTQHGPARATKCFIRWLSLSFLNKSYNRCGIKTFWPNLSSCLVWLVYTLIPLHPKMYDSWHVTILSCQCWSVANN